jgi:hypothetical protein
MHPVFIITIDTEGDNIWSHPEKLTTENSVYLPRFQNLCNDFGFKVTYLVNHEMALDSRFQKFGRAVVKSGAGEIGLHVHPWDSPPLDANATKGDHIYLYELSDELMFAKISYMDGLLKTLFEVRPVSHRAGRWGFDERVARVLSGLGYLVDCSVTPGVSWRRYAGRSGGNGGPDYRDFPQTAYFLDLDDIRQSGRSRLLEVPMTIRPGYKPLLHRIHRSVENGPAGRVFRRAFGPPNTWLRPNGKNILSMLSLVDWAVERGFEVLEFMLHSSELMPNGSPTFRTSEHIEMLYKDLTMLFRHLASVGARGMTLAEYRTTKEVQHASFCVA